MITNVFKATLIKILKTKNFISFLNLHLNGLQTKTRMHLRDFDQTKQIRTVCEKMIIQLREHHDKRICIKFIFDKPNENFHRPDHHHRLTPNTDDKNMRS